MTEQIMMDGEPLEVGNQVYSLRFGKGEVKRFDMDEYPIVVLFGSDIWSFTQDLQADLSDVGRDLYWQKPEIIPPPKPVNGFPDEGALLDLSSDDPLDPPSCNKDDPECEACQ